MNEPPTNYHQALHNVTTGILIVVAVLVVCCLLWAFWPSNNVRRHRVRVMRIRLRLRLHPGRGHATAMELHWQWGRIAAWRRSAQSRKSLSSWQRLRHPAQHSVLLGRAQYRHKLWLPMEEHILIVAPPRTYKTALLGSIIQHYPGPVVSTTTKADVHKLTSGIRQLRGPGYVFNPQHIGGVPSTIQWSPLEGCENPAVAIRRSDAFANALTCEGDNAFFQNAARAYLRGLFHAAALITNGDMRLVSQWALTGTQGGAIPAEEVLRQNGRGQWADQLSQLHGEALRTNATTEMVLAQALGFMHDPALAGSVQPAPGAGFDFAKFLRESGTLYMIASSDSDESPLAPLFAAMASEAHFTATQLGQASDGGRLDPPLLMALDEIVQTCPVPLDKWAADSGGKGIQLITVAHGEAQLASRWKDHGKQVILDTASAIVFMPGITDPKTLEMASKLCGETALMEHGSDKHARWGVMTAPMIRQLPRRRALIIRGGLAPVIARVPAAWKDRQYKRLKKAGTAVAELTPVPAPGSPGDPELGSPLSGPQNEPDRDGPGRAAVAEILPPDDSHRPWRQS
jgi:type IV secretion system protein VirD4